MVRCDICERIVAYKSELESCCECKRKCCKECVSREYWNFDPVTGQIYGEYVCAVCCEGHVPIDLQMFQN